MKEHPNHFQVGILAKDVSPEALPCLEKKIITKKRSYTEGYNCNKGGGGSITSKKIKI